MSSLLAPSRIAPFTRSASSDRTLKSLPTMQRRIARIPFLLVLATVLGAGLVGVLVLNTQIQQQSQALRRAQETAQALAYQQADLQTQVDQLRSSSALEAEAYALGMRPDAHPGFLILTSGKILGQPTAVTGNQNADQAPQTQQQVAAEVAAARAKVITAAKAAAAAKASAAAAAASASASPAAPASAASAKPSAQPSTPAASSSAAGKPSKPAASSTGGH